jgi:type I site-specific restriction-modification system R (restriction) subunit
MSKDTGQKHPPQKSHETELGSSIEELESLIADKATVTINTHPAIPVLDEAIDPDDIYFEDEDFPSQDEPDNSISRDQLAHLIDNMEQKLTGELDELVHILKDAIKDSIITEIKAQLEEQGLNKPTANPAKTEGDDWPK